MQSTSNITNSKNHEDVVTVIDSNVSTLQSYTVSKRTNFGVGPDVFQDFTKGTQNTAFGYGAGGGPYRSSGQGNVFVGYHSGDTCETGSNHTFIGANTALAPGQIWLNGSIALGEGEVITNYNQLMVAPNVEIFNIPGLTSSSGSREGTLLEYDSEGNIIPSAGTYNLVSKIDSEFSSLSSFVSTNTLNISSLQSQVSTNTTDIANLQNSVSLTGLFVPTLSSESDCTATAINLGDNYYGQI